MWIWLPRAQTPRETKAKRAKAPGKEEAES